MLVFVVPNQARWQMDHELTKEGHNVTPKSEQQQLDARAEKPRRFLRRLGSIALLASWLSLPSTCVYSQQVEIETDPDWEVTQEAVPAKLELSRLFGGGPEAWTSPDGLQSSIQVMLTLTVLSLAPAILLMTTSFIRVAVVLGLLRQALGTQQLPPSQVMTSIALFITVLIMSPTWKQVYEDAIVPYTSDEHDISLEQAWDKGVQPVRQFMSKQIEIAGNGDDVWLFHEYAATSSAMPVPKTYDDVPLHVLIPAFMLSELKTAFLIGFNIYLPFLVLDIVVASVTISMGMLMLPPVMISLPFKLMLFVLVDGWTLVVGMLLESFAGGG